MNDKQKKMINFLATFGLEAEDNAFIRNVINSENVSFPLAFAIDFGFATATDKGMAEMTETYNYLQSLADERGIRNLWDLTKVSEELPQRTMRITI